MLLIRAFQRKNTNGICEYEVAVFINTRQIWQGTVGGHRRDQGWAVLAGHIAHKAGMQSPEERDTIEDTLKVIHESRGLMQMHCPTCDKILNQRSDAWLREHPERQIEVPRKK